LDLNDPITEPTLVSTSGEMPGEALKSEEIARFEPAIEVAVDDANKEKYGGFRFFVEDIGGQIGVSDDQTFIASTVITFSDFLGDRRILAAFQSIESFQNFDVIYANLEHRLQWQAHLFDNRDYFLIRDQQGFIDRGRQAISQTGATASLIYPINFGHRASIGAGYIYRELNFVSQVGIQLSDVSDEGLFLLAENLGLPVEPGTTPDELRELFLFFFGSVVPVNVVTPRTDDYPQIEGSLVGDTALFSSWGAVTGRRWRIGASWAPDTDGSGTLTSAATLDFRQFVPITRRMQVAYRLFAAASDGNFATPVYFGGLDTVRGFPFRSLIGDRAFFQNLEIRFPLIDYLATPIVSFQGIRGVVFVDVAGAWFDEFQGFRFYNGDEKRLEDAVASYGFGITVRLFGLDVNWDFAKRWDFDQTLSSFETSFWVGRRF
jgi:hypothetical protein